MRQPTFPKMPKSITLKKTKNNNKKNPGIWLLLSADLGQAPPYLQELVNDLTLQSNDAPCLVRIRSLAPEGGPHQPVNQKYSKAHYVIPPSAKQRQD